MVNATRGMLAGAIVLILSGIYPRRMSRSSTSDVGAAEQPHEEILAMLEMMAQGPVPSFSSLSPAGAREFNQGMFPVASDPTPVGDTLDLSVTDRDVDIRVYVPEGEGPYPTLLYFHGGGWVISNVELYDETCRRFSAGADCMVISVDYGLAPEHSFPSPLKDCYAVAEWVFDNALPMQVDTENVAIGGDSAGGNLAAAVTQMARDFDGPTFDHQLLVYPVTDHNFSTQSYEENGDGGLITEADMRWFWDHYLNDDIEGQHPYASPLKAQSLDGLPPATVVTCGFDPLRDEGAAYANRLEEADIEVDHLHYDDATHGIVQMVTEPMDLTLGNELIDDAGESLSAVFE